MIYNVQKKERNIVGTIHLDGSKSISNRALIIQALCSEPFEIDQLSTSKDTTTMNLLLNHAEGDLLDTGAAGTTFRFLTAYLSLQSGSQILTGSARMKQRPIGVLVEALKELGANIDYLENPGYPPLQIHAPSIGNNNQLTISAGTSSQFISALLMIAPALPNGLVLHLEGTIVSRPYIEMTLSLMNYFGVKHLWEGDRISIAPQQYHARHFTVEADWSAASYYYSIAALADQLDLQLNGLHRDSLQGDAVLPEMMIHFGVQTQFNETGIHLSKVHSPSIPPFEWNFIKCPDIAQSLAVICGGLNVEGKLSGLITLKIKETDRVAALQEELAKVQVQFAEIPSESETEVSCTVMGQAALRLPQFMTYEDHRMAMAFAPLAMLGPIAIEHPMVVVKSYPAFWEDLKKLGFEIKSL
ncbi:MAG: 3-phosphoshikimate 1-carboxyvinyltransferase [Bacteroidota bacterium]